MTRCERSVETLERIKSELQPFGYDGSIHDRIFYCGTGEVVGDTAWLKLLCRVFLRENAYVCAWMLAQLPQEEEFADEKQLIAFIRAKFPL